MLTFPEKSTNTTISVKFSQFTRDQLAKILPKNGQNIVAKETLFDNVYVIEPHEHRFSANIEFGIPFQEFNNNEKNVDVLQFEPRNGVYLKLPTTLDTNNRMLKFQSDTAGVFVFVERPLTPIWIAGIVIPIILVIIIVISTIVYCKLSPNRYTEVKDELSKTKRSFLSRV
ncbi:unnamed protein product [Rotaria sp. Silwood1]|nr:unnamed protein product [Rotaria sp. Silwood1]CAF4840231.1 unnamed protein product [Rotaria sp. Silwood1]